MHKTHQVFLCSFPSRGETNPHFFSHGPLTLHSVSGPLDPPGISDYSKGLRISFYLKQFKDSSQY